jgi:hypothetical protein
MRIEVRVIETPVDRVKYHREWSDANAIGAAADSAYKKNGGPREGTRRGQRIRRRGAAEGEGRCLRGALARWFVA